MLFRFVAPLFADEFGKPFDTYGEAAAGGSEDNLLPKHRTIKSALRLVRRLILGRSLGDCCCCDMVASFVSLVLLGYLHKKKSIIIIKTQSFHDVHHISHSAKLTN